MTDTHLVLLAFVLLFFALLHFLPPPTPAKLAARAAREQEEKVQSTIEHWGHINAALVCPHCQSKGDIRTKHIRQKTGVSGGKATAAVLTGGLSVVVAGLSRLEDRTQCACENCGMTWVV